MKRAPFVVSLGALLAILSAPAGAQTQDRARAEEYFRAGAAAYGAGDFLAAIQALESAYRLTPLPAIAFSLAQAERRQYFVSREDLHLVRAIRLFRTYLSQVPRGGRRTDAAEALEQLETLSPRVRDPAESQLPGSPEGRVTRVMVSSPAPEARIGLDGAAPVSSPLIAEVSPGEHNVSVTAEGFFPANRVLVAVQGELIPVEVPLREKPARVLVQAPLDADLYVDGIYRGPAVGAQSLELPRGRHLFTFAKRGHRLKSVELDLARGQVEQIDTSLSWTRQRWFAVGLLAGSGATLLAGTALTTLSIHEQNRALEVLDRRSKQSIHPEDREDYSEAVESRNRYRAGAAASFALSAGALVTGLILFALDQPNPNEAVPTQPRGPQTSTARKPRLVARGGQGLTVELDF